MKDKAVVLFSSGLDSLGCLQWALSEYKKVTALYINIGVSYSLLEMVNAQAILKKKEFQSCDYRDVHMQFLGRLEGEIGHVPLRNTFFLEIASLFGNDIVFGMLKGEMSEDKNPTYIRRMRKLLNSQVIENLYNKQGRRIRILTPFANKTKTQVVEFLLDYGIKEDILRYTIGCINATSSIPSCGACISCFNRWVALENNGLVGLDTYPGMHPLFWGLDQLHTRSEDRGLKQAIRHASFWHKRFWIKDVYKAYKLAHERMLIDKSPLQLIKDAI